MNTELFEGYKFRDPCQKDIRVEKWDIYAKNQYCPKVKISNWWYHREGYPKDNDDIVRAAYNRLGTWKENKSHWMTETMQAMEEGRGDPLLMTLKNKTKPLRMLSFLSYPTSLKTRKDLLPEEIKKILPSLPRDLLTLRYTTTNQAHYKKVHILPKQPHVFNEDLQIRNQINRQIQDCVNKAYGTFEYLKPGIGKCSSNSSSRSNK